MSFAPLTHKKDVALSPKAVSSKGLRIGEPNDAFEHEADRVANEVLSSTPPKFNWSLSRSQLKTPLQRKCSSGASGECDDCDKTLQRKALGTPQAGYAPPRVDQVLRSGGEPLGRVARDFFEPRFGVDLSAIRIHHDSAAAESAREVSARAYTVGTHIVFGSGEHSPNTAGARGLLAHELAHVLQQTSGDAPAQVQCKGAADSNADIKAKVRKSAHYKAEKAFTEQIIKGIEKKPAAERHALFESLLDALDWKVKTKDEIGQESSASTQDAKDQEDVRLSDKKQVQHTGIEEAGSSDPARQAAWIPVKGKFAGGTYYIDKRSATDIHIKAKIFLRPAAGKNPQEHARNVQEAQNVKAMEDAIEKAASAFGYSVDIIFVNTKEKDAFDVNVDTGRWEVADNWASGGPEGYAHELHHLLAFELDKYNYIEWQSQNSSMVVHERLRWFLTELSKPADWNDSTSIAAFGTNHPNDSDVCTVAGLDPTTCQQERRDARKVRDRLLGAIQRSDGTDIFVATEMIPDALRGPMLGDAEVLTALDDLPAKARIITRARLQFGGSKIPPKVRQLVDAAIARNIGRVADLLQKNPDLHGPFASPAADLDGIKAAVVDVFAGEDKKKVAALVPP
jgi:Domain of unknown function (DUF4157)